MTTSSDGLPLNLRKKDIFFVACFSFFAFSSFFSDSLHALGLLDGDGFWPRATRWYGEIAQDHFFLADHKFLRVNTGISGMVYGPFYLLLVYVGAMLHGCTEFLIYEYWIGPPPGNTFIFWVFNGPYWVIPFMLGVRMWKPNPFGTAPA